MEKIITTQNGIKTLAWDGLLYEFEGTRPIDEVIYTTAKDWERVTRNIQQYAEDISKSAARIAESGFGPVPDTSRLTTAMAQQAAYGETLTALLWTQGEQA